MSILFVNAAFREGSRTLRLAEYYLEKQEKEVSYVELGDFCLQPLNRESLEVYNKAVAEHNFEDDMFEPAKEFAATEEIVIAAPFYNYSIPAVLHTYLELVCSQGVTFDMCPGGGYHSLCKAKKLTYITTAGGPIPEHDHAFDYIKDLCKMFWNIEDIQYIKADGLDIDGVDVERILEETMQRI